MILICIYQLINFIQISILIINFRHLLINKITKIFQLQIVDMHKNDSKDTHICATVDKDQVIRDLKDKMHKAFLEMSDMQKIYQDDMESQKQQFQQKIKELQERNTKLQATIESMASPEKLKLSFDLEDFDQSFIDPPNIKRTSNSFIHDQTFIQLTKKEGFNSEIEKLKGLQAAVRKIFSKIPTEMRDYFQFSQRVCCQNTKLKEQLYRNIQYFEYHKKNCEQLDKKLDDLKKNQAKLKQDNQRLAGMYKQQLDKNIILEKSLGAGRITSNGSIHSTISSASSRNLHTVGKNVSPQPVRIEKDKSMNKTQKDNSISTNISNSNAFYSLRVRGGFKQ